VFDFTGSLPVLQDHSFYEGIQAYKERKIPGFVLPYRFVVVDVA
jgi:hypothetical protein